MANLYDRKFKIGRQSEQILNEEMHKIYESVKYLTAHPKKEGLLQPPAVLDGAFWHDRTTNELKYYDKPNDKFINLFQSKFQITDQITNIYPSSSPVEGQLWIYNDVLMYHSNGQWKPIKALTQDGSQFNISVFENFIFLCPLWKIGNEITEGEDEMFIVDGGSADWDTDYIYISNDTTAFDASEGAKVQMLVPNIDIDRIFIDEKLDRNYEEISKVCISYSKKHIENKVPSLIHINPGKLTSIRKRLFKVDKNTPAIHVHIENTEFYGFRFDKCGGDLLLPFSIENQNKYDYEIQDDGIYLSHNAAQTYDYVLSVTYDHNWFKAYGKLAVTSSDDINNSYHIIDFLGPVNVFVQGFNLEDVSFEIDEGAAVITTNDNTTDMEVSALHTIDREYGFVRAVDLKNRGVIKPIKRFETPLLFVAGEAMHTSELEYDSKTNTYFVPGAKQDMMWSIVELYDSIHDFNMFITQGLVAETNSEGAAVISYDPEKLLDTDCPVLFVNGLLLSESDVIRDMENHTLTAYGLDVGHDYILLNDRYNYLYTDNELVPAIAVERFSESLVYLNGHLLCNSTAVNTLLDEDEISAVHNEVKMFINDSNTFKIYDEQAEVWNILSEDDIRKLSKFVYGYNNSLRSVEVLVPYEKGKDWLQIYAFNYANAVENQLIIENIEVTEPTTEIETVAYIPQTGALSVWLNGVRQYPEFVKDTEIAPGIREDITGLKFYFPEPVTGRVTYTVQAPEKNSAIVSTRELLTHENVYPGMINLYKTNNSLYPGRVTVYINGVRQPQESYTILDNYTLYFHDKTTMLLGNGENYPTEKIIVNDEIKTLEHNESDKIMVEVSMIEKQEQTIEIGKDFSYNIDVNKYNIDINILEPSDEVLIFTNGLFFGAESLNGYKMNKNRGVITITDPTTLNAISSNPLEEFILTNEENAKKYFELYGKEYEHKNSIITLEWR